MRNLKDKVAVITGAASGIGRELAFCLADEGCSVALVDVDHSGLSHVHDLIATKTPSVSMHNIDVGKREQVYTTADTIVSRHGGADILINSAAVVVVETIEDLTYEDFEWVMRVNFWGVVYTTKAFLPYLKQRPEAHIVNISSVDGLVPTPNSGPYCASKAAIRSFTDSLFQELHGTNVSVTCVVPGGVNTSLHRNARFFKNACLGMSQEECIAFFEESAFTSAESAARAIMRAIQRDQTRALVGLDARLIDLVARLMPVRSTALAGHMTRNLNSRYFERLQRLIGKFALK